eukprot:CAMPEP_0183415604 /NCGR_PEP_ID=MMETSP0370-20130417/23222_1 /TAXON_ID=268820 /ORGANISM="Peridinium aciculiferum, Strain PAER-2" /LENGTH=200 /DNA_ID=CAMNT_0025599047 /DNA_START=126 /DNA_END=725 /DNA_ORIENTATION=-
MPLSVAREGARGAGQVGGNGSLDAGPPPRGEGCGCRSGGPGRPKFLLAMRTWAANLLAPCVFGIGTGGGGLQRLDLGPLLGYCRPDTTSALLGCSLSLSLMKSLGAAPDCKRYTKRLSFSRMARQVTSQSGASERAEWGGGGGRVRASACCALGAEGEAPALHSANNASWWSAIAAWPRSLERTDTVAWADPAAEDGRSN